MKALTFDLTGRDHNGAASKDNAATAIYTITVLLITGATLVLFVVPFIDQVTDLPRILHWALVLFAFAIVAIFIPWALILPMLGMAWVLDKETPALILRIIGVVLVVIGFHFDLLAS
ncbi:hypothetical protein ACQEVF_56540 [Nonomuraea polychroma]|uniref:hypothetical protein n=1 Tax=Nonomuraea polychroma TaxID=46176 RepID=UPI003D8A57F2